MADPTSYVPDGETLASLVPLPRTYVPESEKARTPPRQVHIDQDHAGQIRLDQVRADQIHPQQVLGGKIRLEQARVVQALVGQVRIGFKGKVVVRVK